MVWRKADKETRGTMSGRNEIGSEFWDIQQAGENSLFPRETAWFLSGRWALDFVLGDILTEPSISCTAALPSWCCETMIEPFLSRGFEVRFYSVLPDDSGGIRMDFSQVMDCGVLLTMDYFGYAGVSLPIEFEGIVIRDATHSIFAVSPWDADYVFGSLRKWAGFWTGGWAWKQKGCFCFSPPKETDAGFVSLRRQAMEEKRLYLAGRSKEKGYLSIFSEAEVLLESRSGWTGAFERDIAAAKHLDVEFLRQRRQENAGRLLKSVSHMALFPRLEEKDCPLFVPILVPNGKQDTLRRFLIEREIYCPVHWPISHLHRLTDKERQVYEEELSLVCDQRYHLANMERILDAIAEFFEREA